jgi:hypothetical protein
MIHFSTLVFLSLLDLFNPVYLPGKFGITMKTVFIEQTGANGRSVIMNPFKVDGKTYWAGYSSPSETIYISHAG